MVTAYMSFFSFLDGDQDIKVEKKLPVEFKYGKNLEHIFKTIKNAVDVTNCTFT